MEKSHISVIEFPEREMRKNRTESIFEKTIGQ